MYISFQVWTLWPFRKIFFKRKKTKHLMKFARSFSKWHLLQALMISLTTWCTNMKSLKAIKVKQLILKNILPQSCTMICLKKNWEHSRLYLWPNWRIALPNKVKKRLVFDKSGRVTDYLTWRIGKIILFPLKFGSLYLDLRGCI